MSTIPIPNLSQQIYDDALSLYKQGVYLKDIASQLNLGKRAIRKIFKDLEINSKRKNHYTIVHEDYFSQVDTEVKAYLFGIMMADGHADTNNYVALQMGDKEPVELLVDGIGIDKDCLKEIFVDSQRANAWRLNFSSKQMSEDLMRLGVYVDRTEQDSFQLNLNQLFVRHFIRGVFDGDGCCYVSKKGGAGLVSIAGSLPFCNWLIDILDMGIVSKHPSRNVYYWRIHSFADIKKFEELVYNDAHYYLERKRVKFEEIRNNQKRKK